MFYYLLLTLAILWIIDLFQTLSLTRKYGVKVEENPLARFLLKHRNIDFVLFKIIDLVVLSTIMFFIHSQHILLAYGLLVVFILVYLITIIHNHNVIKEQTGKKFFVGLYLKK